MMVLFSKTLRVLPVLLLSGALFAQSATVVVLDHAGNTKEEADVVVTQDSLKGVTGRRASAQLNWSPGKVVAIKWRQAPASYKKGMNAFDDGDYAAAARNLNETLEAGTDAHKWMPVYVNYFLGRALARGAGNSPEAALAALGKALTADPNSRFVPDIYELQAELYATSGDSAKAKAALQKMKEVTVGLDPSYGMRADLGLARAEVRSGDARAGLNALTSLLTKASSDPHLSNLIRMETGNAQVKLKEFSHAEASFRGILDSKMVSNPDVLAGASNGLGDCLFAQDRFREAADSYSKTFAWFYERNAQKDQVGWALYRCALAFEAYSGKETDTEKKEQAAKYSKRLLNKAVKEFRDTHGGHEAAVKLGRATR
jgi:predicted negative regulator of RcsB-dependent stress response